MLELHKTAKIYWIFHEKEKFYIFVTVYFQRLEWVSVKYIVYSRSVMVNQKKSDFLSEFIHDLICKRIKPGWEDVAYLPWGSCIRSKVLPNHRDTLVWPWIDCEQRSRESRPRRRSILRGIFQLPAPVSAPSTSALVRSCSASSCSRFYSRSRTRFAKCRMWKAWWRISWDSFRPYLEIKIIVRVYFMIRKYIL